LKEIMTRIYYYSTFAALLAALRAPLLPFDSKGDDPVGSSEVSIPTRQPSRQPEATKPWRFNSTVRTFERLRPAFLSHERNGSIRR
jgi:hypothetical protein